MPLHLLADLSNLNAGAIPSADLPLTGDEIFPGVQDGHVVTATALDILGTPVAFDQPDAVARSFADRLGEVINVKDFGAGSGDASTDTTAILNAWAAGLAAPGSPHLYFPPGTYYFADDALEIVDDYALFFGDAATIVFKGSGVWQCGIDADAVSQNEFRDLAFRIDTSSSADAPISIYSVGLTRLQRCIFHDIKAAGLAHRKGVVHLRHCDLRMSLTAGIAGIASAIPTGMTGAIFMQGGRGSSGNNADRSLVTQTGAGTLDGCVLQGVQTTQLDHVLNMTPASGGRLSNCISVAGIYDQVDQAAIRIAPATGSSVADVAIIANKVNGWGSSSETSEGLIDIDLTSGATHDADKAMHILGNTLDGANVMGLRCVGGTFGQFSYVDNTHTDYGRQVNVASRAAKISGTFGLLEVAENRGVTSRTHDYDIELTGITATKRRIESNTFGGASPANLASLNDATLRTRREVLTADRTYYVAPSGSGGSDSNAGLVSSSPFLTAQHAEVVIGGLDVNGHTVTVQFADNVAGYTAGIISSSGIVPNPIGGGLIIYQGNATTPANVLFSTSSASCFSFAQRCDIRRRIKDVKLSTATSGDCISASDVTEVQFENVDFGACAGSHLSAGAGGARIFARNAYTISGGAVSHAFATNGGQVQTSGRTITISSTPAFSTAFYNATFHGRVLANGPTYSGSATGKSYSVTSNAVLDANGVPLGIPGDVAGTTATGGEVI